MHVVEWSNCGRMGRTTQNKKKERKKTKNEKPLGLVTSSYDFAMTSLHF